MREKQSNYGMLVAVLLIIIMVLISYIAYSKGLDKSKTKNETTTTVTKTTEVKKINKSYDLDDLCIDKNCSKTIDEIDGLKIKIESTELDDEITNKLIFSGKIDKTINLNKFIKLDIIDNLFILEDLDEKEINIVTLYDEKLNKIEEVKINNLLNKSFKKLEMTYYTYDETCKDKLDYYIKNTTLISSEGFEIVDSTKGPLKDKGFTCKPL